jgi:hypothetical protein
LTIFAFAVTIVGNIVVIKYEQTQGRRLNSHFLLADARHTLSDLYITVSIIIGLVLIAIGYPIMDALASLAVALFVAYSSYRVVRDALPVLVDEAVHDPKEIEQVAEEIPGVEDAEQVRTRGAGPGCFIELTISVATEGLRVVLPAEGDRAIVLEAVGAPEGTAWRFVPQPGSGWQVLLRFPESKEAWKGRFALVLWALQKDDPTLIKDLTAK